NAVTVAFNTATTLPDVRISEYSGVDLSNPFDKTASAVGNSETASTAAVTTAFATELIFAAGMTTGAFNNTAAGFTTRVITSPNFDIAFDENVSAIGSYNASAGQSGGSWVLQMVTFKATGQ